VSDIYDEVDRRETDSRKRLSLNATSVVLCVHINPLENLLAYCYTFTGDTNFCQQKLYRFE